MSSDQNLNHQPSGLVPEPALSDRIRARRVEQDDVGVAEQDAMLAANLGLSASQVQGPAAGEPGQHATKARGVQRLTLVTGADTQADMNWGVLNNARSRPASLVGGNTPVRSPHKQRIALLRAQLERAEQEQLISLKFNSEVPRDEPSSLPIDFTSVEVTKYLAIPYQ